MILPSPHKRESQLADRAEMTWCPGFDVVVGVVARHVRTRVENTPGSNLTVAEGMTHSFLPSIA